MNNGTVPSAAKEISIERQMLKRSLTLLPLFGIIFFTISGGTFGIESLFSSSGAGMALLLIGIIPFVYSIPNILMVRELQSMMPVEGGYYHWTKQAFGPFTGFLTGWMNWVMSWVDVSIYPVLGATYLGFLDSGAQWWDPWAFPPGCCSGWSAPSSSGSSPSCRSAGSRLAGSDQHLDGRDHVHPPDHHDRGRLLELGRPRQHLPHDLPAPRTRG